LIKSFYTDLGTQVYNHLKLGNRRTKVELLDYNTIFPDTTNIVLYLYFSIYSYIVSD